MGAATETAWIHRAASFRWQLIEELCRTAGDKICVQEGTAEGCGQHGRSSDMYRCGLADLWWVSHVPTCHGTTRMYRQLLRMFWCFTAERKVLQVPLIRAEGVCGNSLLLTLTADFELLALPIISQQTPMHRE